ncbi:hypothetical protein [Catenuloplanes indicus]|uniref:Lipoprotein n=1 Tax=Catenuloplanes indicus TaxID=137267 RepID=A0AAE3W3B2_9ACTN|nr:hypothetical protein [Catenuloplanes indicus]MDQ0368555.1 hypothetical protein [Catenuloplanes indicus]
MIRRLGTLTLAALVLTACTNSGDDSATGPAPSPVPSAAGTASTAPVTAAPAPSGTAAAPSGTAAAPSSGAPAPGETGDGDWKSALAAALACPAAALPVEQGPLVNRDLTGDGVPDVLVAAACTGSTSSWPSVVHAYDGAPPAGQWRRLGVLLSQKDGTDERGLRVKKILIDDGAVVVTSRAFQQQDDNASGGTLTVTDRFTWSGTGFTRGERTIA